MEKLYAERAPSIASDQHRQMTFRSCPLETQTIHVQRTPLYGVSGTRYTRPNHTGQKRCFDRINRGHRSTRLRAAHVYLQIAYLYAFLPS